MTRTGISVRNGTRNRNSGSYEPEPELTFVVPVPVKPEPELNLEIPVPVIRTGTEVLEFRSEPELQPELKYYCKSIYFTRVLTKTDAIYSFLFN